MVDYESGKVKIWQKNSRFGTCRLAYCKWARSVLYLKENEIKYIQLTLKNIRL